jgi:hypothetical protein
MRNSRLDTWLADLAAQPTDRDLGGLAAEVARDISRRRLEARAVKVMAPVRVVTLGVAIAIGAFAGGAMAISAHHEAVSAFAVGSELAPSSLLEGV